MSENMSDTYPPHEVFQANEINNSIQRVEEGGGEVELVEEEEAASELFELINQLNDDEESNDDRFSKEELNINVNNDANNKQHARLVNQSKTLATSNSPFESLIRPIETVSSSNTKSPTTNFNTNTNNTSSFQSQFENMNLSSVKSSDEASYAKPTPIKSTKIPRIPALHKKENTAISVISDSTSARLVTPQQHLVLQQSQQINQDSSSSSATTSPTNSLSYKLTKELNKLTYENARNPRSLSKPPSKFKFNAFTFKYQ